MAQSGEQTSGLPVAALVVTAIAAGGFLAMQEPLTSLRHKESIDAIATDTVDENVDARLWQDPMQAIHGDWNRLISSVAETGRLPPAVTVPHTISSLRSVLMRDSDVGKVLRIVVMMPSNPYADDAEHRRRQRYALVTALSTSGFSAKNANRIGYFIAPGMKESGSMTELGAQVCRDPVSDRWLCPMPERPLLAGFETFVPDTDEAKRKWDQVMVIWLDRRELGTRQLPNLLALTNFLKPTGASRVETVLLGPDDSGSLITMYQNKYERLVDSETSHDFCYRALAFGPDSRAHLLDTLYRSVGTTTIPDDVAAEPVTPGLVSSAVIEECNAIQSLPVADADIRDIHILSPRSTVPLEILFPEGEFAGLDQAAEDRLIARRLNTKGFHTVLARDDIVIANIVDELYSRGLSDCRSASGIAVVSEVDSSYGRLLPSVVEQAIENRMGCEIAVHAFGYLRGVDGELPPGVQSAASQAKIDKSVPREGGELELSLGTSSPDLAVGAAQTDYIRRLSDHIARRHVELGEHGHVGFRAIGVLGSDVYDKQLILHALRERLPAVTFFTTDLDARLNAPSEYQWSRNLIIGSAFGLSPPEEEVEVAPLRDSYQLAFFRAAELALEVTAIDRSPAIYAEIAKPPPPRLFEIGRSGAIDITICGVECQQQSGSEEAIGWVRHAGSIGDEIGKTLFLVSPLMALALVSFGVGKSLARNRCADRLRAKKRVLQISAFSTLFFITILWSWDGNNLEPWLITEGISSVPALILHLTAIVYSFCFILIVQGRIRQSNSDCERKFPLTDRREHGAFLSMPAFHEGWLDDTLLRNWVRNTDEVRGGDTELRKLSIREVWKKYRMLGVGWARTLRILPPVLAWSLAVIFVLNQDANPLLARNLQAFLDVVRIVTVFTVVGVIYVCIDALRLGRHLIRALAYHDLQDWYENEDPADQASARIRQLKMKMKLIVTHSELLSPFLVLPFILLFLLILARLTLFEGWVWTPSLIGAYLGFSVYLLVRALLYQKEAANARAMILEELRDLRIENASEESFVREIGFVIDEIKSIDHGAFVPWTRHPIVQSVIVPTGGVGILSLLGLLT